METSQPGAEAPPALPELQSPAGPGREARVCLPPPPPSLSLLLFIFIRRRCDALSLPENSSRHRRSALCGSVGSGLLHCLVPVSGRARDLLQTTPSSDPGGSICPAHKEPRRRTHVRCLAGVDFRVRGSSGEPGISVAG